MKNNWKEFWKNCSDFSKKVDAEESLAVNIVAFVLFCSGCGFVANGFLNSLTWAIVIGLIGLTLGDLVFRINTAIAKFKAMKKIDNDRK